MNAWTTKAVALAVLVGLVGAASPLAAQQPNPPGAPARTDPCDNYRKPRGSLDDKSSASLVEHAARVAAGDQSAIMGGRGPAADYAVDPTALEALTPQGKFVLCWFAELEGNLMQINRQLSAYEDAYKCQNKADKMAQVDVDKRKVRTMIEHLPSFSTRESESSAIGLRGNTPPSPAGGVLR